MYSEELQRSHAPPEPCDLPRSELTQPVIDSSMRKYMGIKRLEA